MQLYRPCLWYVLLTRIGWASVGMLCGGFVFWIVTGVVVKSSTIPCLCKKSIPNITV